ncbi:MAG TPA: DUF1697 domain-containing protein [Dokdonella sp.]
MRLAAFFRNLNLGRAGSPTKAQLVAAFEAAGAHDVLSVHAHGNVAFSAAGVRTGRAIAAAASEQLRLLCGLDEPVFVRSVNYLAGLIAARPFASAPADDIHEQCVTFLPHAIAALTELPIVSARRDAEIFAFVPGEAFSVTRLVSGRPGAVNALLERRLRTRLTSRSWTTVERMAQALPHARAAR